ncbi:MAG: serine hydrolase [Proteobacteria bacterium]|nr:serine hydrolase [Pseudomonadota bacterium]
MRRSLRSRNTTTAAGAEIVPYRATTANVPFRAGLFAAVVFAAIVFSAARPAAAEALLLIDANSGKVLHAQNAAYPWYPASVTKLMTAYVTLKAVREGRMPIDRTLRVSRYAAAQAPSKMGFKPGTIVTVDNALKMLLVKSANDIAVVLAEGVSGSVEKFANEMNASAQRLGMTQSIFVNPNGLPADNQISSARDLAILARAIIRDFPEYEPYWRIPAIRFGKRLIRNTNRLIDAYPGADGMKTGFICASGFNVVATATRGNKRLIAVVLGAPSASVRTLKAAQLFERGFAENPLSWLTPSLGSVDALVPVNATPPNLREDVCGRNRKRPAAEETEEELATTESNSPLGFLLSTLRSPQANAAAVLGSGYAAMPPVVVYTGPARPEGAVARAGDGEATSAKPKSGRKAARAGGAKSKKRPAQAAAVPAAAPPKTAAIGTKPARAPGNGTSPALAAGNGTKPALAAGNGTKPALTSGGGTKPAVAKRAPPAPARNGAPDAAAR